MKTKHLIIITAVITFLIFLFGMNTGASETPIGLTCYTNDYFGGQTYIPSKMVSSTSDFIPYTDSTYDLGNTSKRWAEGWFEWTPEAMGIAREWDVDEKRDELLNLVDKSEESDEEWEKVFS